MSAPVEVVVKGSEKTIGYACSTCHMFSSPKIYSCNWEAALEAALDHATRCCDKKCEDCGAQLEKQYYWTVCPTCKDARDDAKEAKRFDDAVKIHEAEYTGWAYDENSTEYYPSVDEWRDGHAGDLEDEPAHLWATSDTDGFTLDACDIVQSALENADHHEDAYDSVDDIEGLQKMLDEWCAKQDIKSYMVDYTRAVVLAPPKPEPGDE